MVILFSQVREDYVIEESILSNITNPDVLLVGSGGCTALSILDDNINHIDIVDSNIDQINLIKMKILIIKNSKEKNIILDIFEGKFSIDQYNRLFMDANLSQDLKEFCKENQNEFYNGINQSGAFEKLFKKLVESDFDFKKLFNREYLIGIFGEDSCAHSVNKEFYDHFMGVMENYKRLSTPDNNYFYHQILFNKYNTECVPKYLTDEGILNVNAYSDKIEFYTNNFLTFLKNSPKNKFDMIQTSNLTDWISDDERNEFIKECWKCVKPSGYVVMRRLNGDYKLTELTKKHFKQSSVEYVDTSYFYAELFIGSKIDID